ncbi:MAG: PfkB family carbohydrate kinase [Acidimicrobiales bacterium]
MDQRGATPRQRRVVVVGDVMSDVVVRPLGPIVEASDTASSIVFAPGGSATSQAVWLAHAGAEVHLVAAVGDDAQADAAADLPEELFVDGAHLHLSGYVLLDAETRPAGLAALATAHSRAMTRSVDACSAAPIARVGTATFLGWTAGVDLLCSNREEAAVLSSVGSDADPDAVASAAISARSCSPSGPAEHSGCAPGERPSPSPDST